MFYQLINYLALVFYNLSDIKTLHVTYENLLIISTKTELRNGGYYSKWFEPKSICSSYCVIVRVSVVLKRTVVGD